MFEDTGANFPESDATLHAQQQQLLAGLRPAQMFPLHTKELPLPNGFLRFENERGVFHFNPALLTVGDVSRLSGEHRENVLLALGPYDKSDVADRVAAGEPFLVVTERTADGVEVKAAAGSESTIPEQVAEFERTKLPGSAISVETISEVLMRRLAAQNRRAA